MTSEVERVLRRACARFKTGIRRPFKVGGDTVRLEPAGYFMDEDLCADDSVGHVWCEANLLIEDDHANALDGSRFIHKMPLTVVTPEAVWEAYLQSQVNAVHAL
jgi:hypothetical protein